MAALTLFPLQYKRQDAVPVDIDLTFATTAERNAYLTNARRYAGMLVVDIQEDKAYLLNSARNAWVPVGSGAGEGELFIFQVGARPSEGGGVPSINYETFFAQDVNENDSPEDEPLTATPNSDAKQAEFLNGLSGTSTQNFEEVPVGLADGTVLSFAGGITATLGGSAIEVKDALESGRYSVPVETTTRYLMAQSGADFTITFSQNIAAFGFYGIDIGDFNGSLQLSVRDASDNEIQLITVPVDPFSFGGSVIYFGITSQSLGSDFRSIRFLSTNDADFFGFDNFTIAKRAQLLDAHVHYATMTTQEAESLISGSQASLTLTTSAAGDGPHSHNISVEYDYEGHKFDVVAITSNHAGVSAHEGHVVGDGPVRHNTEFDAIEYFSSEEGGWADVSKLKVRTKTADYTLTSKDNQHLFRMSSSSDISLIIPDDLSVNIPIGFTVVMSKNGAGETFFQAGSGVTILTPASLSIGDLYGKASIVKTGPNRWEADGNLTPTEDGLFMFQVGVPSPIGDHIHWALMTTPQAKELVFGTDPEIAVGDILQPSLVLTTVAAGGLPGHTHDITVVFDYNQHTFVVTNITNNSLDNHVASLIGRPGVFIQNEGTPLGVAPLETLNFVGANVIATSSDDGKTAVVTISGGGGGGSVYVQDEGASLGGNALETLNFVGTVVSATSVDGGATVNVAVANPTVYEYNQASVTMIPAHLGNIVRMGYATTQTYTVTETSGSECPIGTSLVITWSGIGLVTIVQGANAVIYTPETLNIRKRYGQVTLTKMAAPNIWQIEGNLQSS